MTAPASIRRATTDWRHKARLRVRELAEVASVSVTTVRRAIRSGELESYVQSGCRFVPIEAALCLPCRARALLARLEEAATPQPEGDER